MNKPGFIARIYEGPFKKWALMKMDYFSAPEWKLWVIFDGDANFDNLWHHVKKRFNFY